MKFPHKVLPVIHASSDTTTGELIRSIFNKITFFGSPDGMCISLDSQPVISELKAELASSPEVIKSVTIGNRKEIESHVESVKSQYEIIWYGSEKISLVRAHQDKVSVLLGHLKRQKETAAFLPVLYTYNFGAIHEESFDIRNVIPSFYTIDCNYLDGSYIYKSQLRVLDDEQLASREAAKAAITSCPFLVSTRFMFKSINNTSRINTVPIEHYL